MKLTELRELYDPVSKTYHPRVLVGHNGPRKGQDYVLLFNDDSGDWDRSGPVYPTKAEAFANVPAAAQAYFGTSDPAAPGNLPTPRRVQGVYISRSGDRLPSELTPGEFVHFNGSVRQIQHLYCTGTDAPVLYRITFTDGAVAHADATSVFTLTEPPTPGVLPFTVTDADHPHTTATHTGQTTLMIGAIASFRAHNLFTQAARELFNLAAMTRPMGALHPVRVWFEHQTTNRQGYDYASGNLVSWDLTPNKVGRMTFDDGTELFDRLLVRVTF